MKSKLLLTIACLLALGLPSASFADDELTQAENSLNDEAKKPNYEATLKEKYTLTDEQLKAMHDKGMNNQQITIAAQLSKESGKSIDEVVKMRTEDKMGWGKIAKDLGVHPSAIGKGVSSMRHDLNEKRSEARNEKSEQRQAKREERAQKREEKRSQREQKQSERKEKKGRG